MSTQLALTGSVTIIGHSLLLGKNKGELSLNVAIHFSGEKRTHPITCKGRHSGSYHGQSMRYIEPAGIL